MNAVIPKYQVVFWGALIAGCGLLVAGCALLPDVAPEDFLPPDTVIGSNYKPHNIYCLDPTLPKEIRRVAVLPLTTTSPEGVAVDGRDDLTPVLQDELSKVGAFEVVVVTPKQLSTLSGKARWSAEEQLPSDFFSTLESTIGCDGVLFCCLTQYQPYPPIRIGWHLKLVDTKHQKILWAADEVFNAGESAVANGARRYYKTHCTTATVLLDSSAILTSPQLFGHYTASLILSTLPNRQALIPKKAN